MLLINNRFLSLYVPKKKRNKKKKEKKSVLSIKENIVHGYTVHWHEIIIKSQNLKELKK